MNERIARLRMRDDFHFYAKHCLKIREKSGEIKPLVLNSAQKYLESRIEQQKARTGRVRIIVLKGRQQGCSTYTEARFFWKTTHRSGIKAYIMTHHSDATANIFKMAKRYYTNCPIQMRPSISNNNKTELIFDKLDSGYQVSTAGSQGAGRSDTIQMFHGSEVAFWANAGDHLAGAMQAVPDEPGTEIILESTSAGPSGTFYDYCMAAQRGENSFELVFIPWYWQEEYRLTIPDFTPTDDEKQYGEKYGLDIEQLAWRRNKISELNSIEKFRREYPADFDEAFKADVKGALWKRDLIQENRVHDVPALMRTVVAIDPAITAKKDSDETGIITAAVGVDGHCYILDDSSMISAPEIWADKGVELYDKHIADAIVGETNQGGDMVETTIRTSSRRVNYKGVHASKGKYTRAEPVAALYAKGLIHHVGTFTTLEDQMVTWSPLSQDSPDRVDALVWAVTELMLGDEKEPGIIEL
jgi:phage terminase large subunit-like protein